MTNGADMITPVTPPGDVYGRGSRREKPHSTPTASLFLRHGFTILARPLHYARPCNHAGRTSSVAAHKFHNPSTMPATRGYTHVVETRGPSRTLYLAGQLGMTPDGKFAGSQAFENLKHALTAAGATFE